LKRLNRKIAQKTHEQAIREGLVDPADFKAAIYYLREALDYRIDQLQTHFPEPTLHAVAIKTNNHPEVLRHLVRRGMGLEAASLEEVKLAVNAGCPPERLVFDSPVKTRGEIDYVHRKLPGMQVNANSLAELQRYPADFSGKLGLRINPERSSDAPAIFDVSGKQSKFGVPLSQRKSILETLRNSPPIKGLHLHMGSDMRDFKPHLKAVAAMVGLARELQEVGQNIEWLDIGGGILFGEEAPYRLADFTHALAQVPGIARYRLITEYGKYVHHYNSLVVSRVEYLTPAQAAAPDLAYIHVGADLFVRKVYSDLPIDYPCVALARQTDENRPEKAYRLVGPLCFAGDVLYERVKLPQLREGDLVALLHTGANTFSMWSGHCSRTPPPHLFL
jgi:diaminopimelate decarboxylase